MLEVSLLPGAGRKLRRVPGDLRGKVKMPMWRSVRTCLWMGLIGACTAQLPASQHPGPAKTSALQARAERDGQHDFDFELGSWKMHLRRRLHPLTSSDKWVNFEAESVTRKVWQGRAQLEEFEAAGPPPIEGLTLRLYDPQCHQWRLYWSTSKDGVIGPPMIGEFRNGTGRFFDQELFQGKAIYVRYVWKALPPHTAHFEQSFSDDGGATWETNWITDDTRISDDPAAASAAQATQPTANQAQGAKNDGQRAFDFEFGAWKTHLRVLLHPLTDSHTWVDYEGTSTVRKVWDGRANLGELEVGDASTHIEGLSLRLYNPQTGQWNIYWANSKEGILGQPMTGGFKNGRGEFFDQETIAGKALFVRFIFSDITPGSFHFEQSFSSDGGKSWEPNWIATFTRQR